MEPRKASPAKDGPFGFMSEERVDDDIMKEEKAFFGAVRPDEPLIEDAPVQRTDQVLLISPTAFGYNPEAAKDNRFMHAVDEGELDISIAERAISELGINTDKPNPMRL